MPRKTLLAHQTEFLKDQWIFEKNTDLTILLPILYSDQSDLFGDCEENGAWQSLHYDHYVCYSML